MLVLDFQATRCRHRTAFSELFFENVRRYRVRLSLDDLDVVQLAPKVILDQFIIWAAVVEVVAWHGAVHGGSDRADYL